MDRIDMRIAVTPPEPSRLIRASVTPTGLFREKVLSARLHQRSRLKRACATYGNPRTNARIPPALISDICSIKGSAEKLFLSGMTSYGLSARAGHSILKVARTIADLDARTDIGESAIEEAMEYRQFGDGDAVWPI